MADKKVKGVDNTFRRTWDRDTFEKRALDRAKKELDFDPDEERGNLLSTTSVNRYVELPVISLKDLKPVQARDEGLDFSKMVGKTVAVSPATPASLQGGFYCEKCDCAMKDSASWLDHINGKKHQRMLGTSLTAERSSLDQVRDRLQMHKQKKMATHELEFERKMELLRKQEAEKREEKKRKKRGGDETKIELPQVDPQTQDELSIMGLPVGFGTSKK